MGAVFGTPLKESLKHASVQISTADAKGKLYVWGYIPVVVAKWCVYAVIALPPPLFFFSSTFFFIGFLVPPRISADVDLLWCMKWLVLEGER